MARFKCPKCNEHNGTIVRDSRTTLDGAVIRRRRECAGCGDKFTTYETLYSAKDRYTLVRMEAVCETLRRELERLMELVHGESDAMGNADRKRSKKAVENGGHGYTAGYEATP